MTTKKNLAQNQYLHADKRAFLPCELTPGSTIAIDGYTLSTNGITTIDMRISPDTQLPLVCTVRSVHGVHYKEGIHYLVETDVEYNQREKKVLHEDFHVFSITYVNKILHRVNAPMKYKWIQPLRECNKYLLDMLFDICPDHQFDIPKVAEYLHEQGLLKSVLVTYSRKLFINEKPKHRKKLKEFLKRHHNKLKSFKQVTNDPYQ